VVGQLTVGNSARQYEIVRDSMRQDSAVTNAILRRLYKDSMPL